ncbi:hypothetical protein RCL1_002417 [Eukaryota sp. TZLM3-RCL]
MNHCPTSSRIFPSCSKCKDLSFSDFREVSTLKDVHSSRQRLLAYRKSSTRQELLQKTSTSTPHYSYESRPPPGVSKKTKSQMRTKLQQRARSEAGLLPEGKNFTIERDSTIPQLTTFPSGKVISSKNQLIEARKQNFLDDARKTFTEAQSFYVPILERQEEKLNKSIEFVTSKKSKKVRSDLIKQLKQELDEKISIPPVQKSPEFVISIPDLFWKKENKKKDVEVSVRSTTTVEPRPHSSASLHTSKISSFVPPRPTSTASVYHGRKRAPDLISFEERNCSVHDLNPIIPRDSPLDFEPMFSSFTANQIFPPHLTLPQLVRRKQNNPIIPSDLVFVDRDLTSIGNLSTSRTLNSDVFSMASPRSPEILPIASKPPLSMKMMLSGECCDCSVRSSPFL